MPGKTEKIRRWQKAEIGYLERHRKTKSLEELARHFKTDVKTIKAKLAELKPGAAGKRQEAEADDPELKAFATGLTAMQKKDYAKAAKLFTGLMADDDRPELVARAR
ncbi:MAG TPA: hypothetical protein VOA87_06655, partial [Thermoanaerobaculia bacterium]|nr:hypothetical protein [Thermoanaerobaculia bacterium]